MTRRLRERSDVADVSPAPIDVLFEAGSLDAVEATVCITLYNYERFAIEALTSVYDQSLESLAVVVVDDHSSDGGPARVQRWMAAHAGRFSGLRLTRHRCNQGLAGARNGAVAMCESEYVMILDADNLLYPRCVERLLASLKGSNFGFAYPIIERFGESPALMGCQPWDLELLKLDNFIDAMALIRKSVWSSVGGYTKMSVSGWEDYDFWCKCVEVGFEGIFVPEILARYREHGRSMLKRETNQLANARRVREEMRGRHPWLELRDCGPGAAARRRRRDLFRSSTRNFPPLSAFCHRRPR